MCFRDYMREVNAILSEQGRRRVSETQIRWAMTKGRISRPPLDGSLRYDFGTEHVKQALAIFGEQQLSA
jgi:hypothetical protein